MIIIIVVLILSKLYCVHASLYLYIYNPMNFSIACTHRVRLQTSLIQYNFNTISKAWVTWTLRNGGQGMGSKALHFWVIYVKMEF